MYQLTQTGNEINSLLTTILNNNDTLNNLPNQLLLLQQQNTNISNMINSLNNYYNPKVFIDKTYPVGTIYKAKSGVNPNTLFSGTKWETIEEINDREYINNYFGTTNLEVITHNDGTKWVPIVQHCVDSGSTLYSGVAQAKQCTTVGKISNLYLFEKTHNIFKNSNGWLYDPKTGIALNTEILERENYEEYLAKEYGIKRTLEFAKQENASGGPISLFEKEKQGKEKTRLRAQD